MVGVTGFMGWAWDGHVMPTVALAACIDCTGRVCWMIYCCDCCTGLSLEVGPEIGISLNVVIMGCAELQNCQHIHW
jgi:hypothetical protein